MALILSVIVHKATVDISAIAQKHSGGEFWRALAQYVISNMAVPCSPGQDRSRWGKIAADALDAQRLSDPRSRPGTPLRCSCPPPRV
jgi:hypothetical protein